MAHHGVEGVRGPVHGHAGRTGDGTPQQRPRHGIGRVLRHRLDPGPAQLRGPERGGIAPGQRGKQGAGPRQVAAADGGGQSEGRPLQ